jgi:hypothetical protein
VVLFFGGIRTVRCYPGFTSMVQAAILDALVPPANVPDQSRSDDCVDVAARESQHRVRK